MIKADFRRPAAAGGESHPKGSGTDGHAAHKAAPSRVGLVLAHHGFVTAGSVEADVQKVLHDALANE
jgi:hypothetical protein